MTNEKGWGSEWPSNGPKLEDVNKLGDEAYWKDVKANPEAYGLDRGDWPSKFPSARATFWPKEAIANSATLNKQGSNLVDDQAQLYFQCESCNEILDPHTKSFAKLQEAT